MFRRLPTNTTLFDKAAQEMKDRVRKMLGDFVQQARSQQDRAKLTSWLEEIGEARISTIHSFGLRILK